MRSLDKRFGIVVFIAASVAVAIPASGPARGTERADLSLTKTDAIDPVISGSTLGYRIEVANAGPSAAPKVAITDNLPGGVEALSATPSAGTCTVRPRKVVCKSDELAAEATLAVVIEVTVNKKKGALTNSASVQSGLPDPRPADNSDTEATSVAPPPNPVQCQGRDATIVGTDAQEAITGTERRDVVVALGGDDSIATLGGPDVICAGAGDDFIRSMADPDLVSANSGNDVVRGGGASDELGGGVGRDRLYGGFRPDLLRGGPGRDRCFGGLGRDRDQSC